MRIFFVKEEYDMHIMRRLRYREKRKSNDVVNANDK